MIAGKPIPGMIDCKGVQVCEGDLVEFFDWCYASASTWDPAKGGRVESPLYGVVRWNTEYFTYEPLIFSEEDYNGNCFANVCREDPKLTAEQKAYRDNAHGRSYFRVVKNPLGLTYNTVQKVGQ